MGNIEQGPDGQTPESLKAQFELFDKYIQDLKLALAHQKEERRSSRIMTENKEEISHSSASGGSLACRALLK